MLRLHRHQQRAFLYECGRNIKRLFAAYCVETGENAYQKLTRDHKKRVVLQDAELQNDTYHKLQTLISLYNKVEAINFNAPAYEFKKEIHIPVTRERDALKTILINEANNALCANGSKPRDQQLVDFLYQFHYLDWYIPADNQPAADIGQIKTIREALALEDLLQILRDEGILIKCFAYLDCLSKDFESYLEQHDDISPLALLYLYRKDQALYKPGQDHRPNSGLTSSFGDDPRIGQAKLTHQEEYLLAAAILGLQFTYEKLLNSSNLTGRHDFGELKHAHFPIQHGKALQNLSQEDFDKLIKSVKDISKKYRDLPASILIEQDNSAKNNNHVEDNADIVQARENIKKPEHVNVPQYFGIFAYANYKRTVQKNPEDSIVEPNTIAELVKQANQSLLASVLDDGNYNLVWDNTVPLEITVDEKYNNLIRVKAVRANLQIQNKSQDAQADVNEIGNVHAQVDFTFEYTPSADGSGGTYQLLQIWTNRSLVGAIYRDQMLKDIKRILPHADQGIIDELNKIDAKKTRAIEDEFSRLAELRSRYGVRNLYDANNIKKADFDKLVALMRDLPTYNQHQQLVDNVITEITTAFNVKLTSKTTKQRLMRALQATNFLLMHADKPESEQYRLAFNHFVSVNQTIRKIAKLNAVAASLTMLAAAIAITVCVLLTIFTAGAGAAIGVPGFVTGALKAGLFAVGSFGLFAGSVGKVVGVAAACKSHRHFKISNSLTKLANTTQQHALPAPTWRPT